jgi:hypothetical protein
VHRAGLFEPVDVRDVGVIERRERLGFAFEPGEALGVVRERFGQDLERRVTRELRIARAIDFAHPAFADFGEDFVHADPSMRRQGHESAADYSRAVALRRCALRFARSSALIAALHGPRVSVPRFARVHRRRRRIYL